MAESRSVSLARRVLLALGVLAFLLSSGIVLVWTATKDVAYPVDYPPFWSAGRLAWLGENPYDGVALRELQKSFEESETATIAWNPPWCLTVLMPFGILDYRTAYTVWLLFHMGLLIVAIELLWNGLEGRPASRGIAYLIALANMPAVYLIGTGQITTLVLFGVGGFLAAARANRPILAGIFVAFAANKPHLLGIFALWLMLEGSRNTFGRRVLVGGVITGILACIPPTLANPDVWWQYAEAITGPSSANHFHMSYWEPPLVGFWVRQAIPGNPFWAQWTPLLAFATGFVIWFYRTSKSTAFRLEVAPWAVGISLLAAPYGVWPFDLVLLQVPILQVAAAVSRHPVRATILKCLAVLIAFDVIGFAMMAAKTDLRWYLFFTPSTLLACWYLNRKVTFSEITLHSPPNR